MKIEADEEAKKLIHEICNLALLAGGLKALNYVNTILSTLNTPKPKKEKK